MNAKEIRQQFIDFFENKQHKIVPSAPMVLKDDPTLMFTNAGMVPFKEFFLGESKVIDKRIADSQKCLRVSGKHNDLEEVGKDTYHHTMFEMLGNWSFGDYFKKKAIAWAWELLTEVYKIDKNNIYVTVFEGDKSEDLDFDQEAYDFWKQHIAEDRILNGNKKDNFWEMGAQGPCGPCSEIHVDIRSEEEKAKVDGKTLVNMDHPQVIEIWNLVFMQYNRKANGTLEYLPAKHVDTGMGFERLCMVVQGVQSNYDTDVFTPLIREVETITQVRYEDKKLPAKEQENIDIAIRVISDHIRAVSFAIADGKLPSNTGAGYVIRRILRRAIRYGFTFLNKKEPFMYRLVDLLARQMGDAFPELKAQKQLISNVIKEEENSFLKTLEQGLVLLDGIIKSTNGKIVSGKQAFQLYDTFGFPIDLTALILSERGYTLDEKVFQEELQKQKERSRSASKVETDDWIVLLEDEDEEFIGYDLLETPVKIAKYRKVTSTKDGDMYQLVFNLTPFYPEGGGQVGDKGYLEANNGNVVYILDTKKENNLIIHFSKHLPKNIRGTFRAVVDEKQRFRTECNHTATHLLQQGLRKILGKHIEQKGSLVRSKYLRFDFSHFSKVTAQELVEVENFVNARIRGKLQLKEYRNIPMKKAIDKGALALFGEKYGDAVRMIQFGKSKELCGGTHVKNTGDIWHFKILTESSVASGVRRIEAITNDAVKDYFTSQDKELLKIKKIFKSNLDTVQSVLNLHDENANLKKQVAALLKEKSKFMVIDLVNQIETVNGVNFLATTLELDPKSIKDVLFDLGNKTENFFGLIGSKNGDKAMLSCYISKALVENNNLNAGTIVKELGKFIQGGGGGQAFFATAGGKNQEGITIALKNARAYVE